jgi:hypothetical protein
VTLTNDGTGGVLLRWVGLEGQVYTSMPRAGHAMVTGAPPSAAPGYAFIPPSTATDIDVASDDTGGAMFATSEPHAEYEIRAYRTRADGALDTSWPAAGIVVAGGPGARAAPRAVSDGTGGAFVAWQDQRDGVIAAYLTRVTGAGAIPAGWPVNGLRLGTWPASGNGGLDLRADGSGGAVVGLLGADVQLFRVTGSGAPAAGWSAAGLRVTTSASISPGPVMTVASDGGIYLAWTEGPATSPVRVAPVRLLRVTPGGVVDARWPTGGFAFAAGTDSLSDPALSPAELAGTYLVWGALSITGERSLRAVRMTQAGSVAAGWDAAGTNLLGPGDALALDNTIYEWEHPAVFAAGPDAGGGLFVAWDDRGVPGTTQVRVSRFLPTGTRQAGWPEDGHLVAASTGNGRVRSVLGDATGNAFVAWRSISVLPFGSPMLSQAVPDAALSVDPVSHPAILELINEGGNPATGALVLGCRVAGGAPGRLDLYDVSGRRLRTVPIEPGATLRRIVVAGPGELSPGIVFARLIQDRDERRLTLAVIR